LTKETYMNEALMSKENYMSETVQHTLRYTFSFALEVVEAPYI